MEKNNKIHLVIIGGIRTHYIKIFSFQQTLRQLNPELLNHFKMTFIDAGQHYDVTLHDDFISELNILFDYQIKHKNTIREQLWGSMFEQLCSLLKEINQIDKIDYVVVFGDVITTLISSISALLCGIKIVHIESGVRNPRKKSIEENCSIVTDHISAIRFASCKNDMINLYNEGLSQNSIFSGDIIFDYINNLTIPNELCKIKYKFLGEFYEFDCTQKYIIISLHHLENQDQLIVDNVFRAVEMTDCRVLFIIHPVMKQYISEKIKKNDKVILIEHIPYYDNLIAIQNSQFIITDSGGMQREAFYLNKRCIVRSYSTIWESIVESGSSIISGYEYDEILNSVQWAEINKNFETKYDGSFGCGNASEIILNTIKKQFIS